MAIAQQAQQPNRRQPKKVGKNKFAHTADTPYGMGDNYGTGVRAKLGTMRSDSVGMAKLSKKKLGTPPKSLA
jgi:hypothetical protein